MNFTIWFLFGVGLFLSYCIGYMSAIEKAQQLFKNYIDSLALTLKNTMSDEEILNFFQKHDNDYFKRK